MPQAQLGIFFFFSIEFIRLSTFQNNFYRCLPLDPKNSAISNFELSRLALWTKEMSLQGTSNKVGIQIKHIQKAGPSMNLP